MRSLQKATNIYITLILLCWCGFFGFYHYLPVLGSLYSVDAELILMIPIVAVFLIYFVVWNKGHIVFRFTNCRFFWYFSLFLAFLFVYSLVAYHQSLFDTLKLYLYFFVPLFSIFVYFQAPQKCRNKKALFSRLEIIGLLCSAVAIVAYVLLKRGVNILRVSYSLRNGTPRFSIGIQIVIPGLIYSIFACAFDKKIYSQSFLNILLSAIHLIVLAKTRSLMFYLLITIVIMILFFMRKPKTRLVIAIFSCLVILTLIFFSKIVTFLTSYFEADAGIMIRFSTMSYYLSEFASHPIFGIGFVSANGPYWYMATGQSGLYYFDDVGIIGYLVQYGIIGLVLLVALLGACIKHSHVHCSYTSLLERTFIFYLILSMINLSFLDSERLLYLFLLFAIDDIVVGLNQKRGTIPISVSSQRRSYLCRKGF